jgi:hypothetical protein
VQKPVYGLVGAIKLIAGHFLVVITSKSRVGFLNDHEIFKADKFEMIAFHKNENHLNENEVIT